MSQLSSYITNIGTVKQPIIIWDLPVDTCGERRSVISSRAQSPAVMSSSPVVPVVDIVSDDASMAQSSPARALSQSPDGHSDVSHDDGQVSILSQDSIKTEGQCCLPGQQCQEPVPDKVPGMHYGLSQGSGHRLDHTMSVGNDPTVPGTRHYTYVEAHWGLRWTIWSTPEAGISQACRAHSHYLYVDLRQEVGKLVKYIGFPTDGSEPLWHVTVGYWLGPESYGHDALIMLKALLRVNVDLVQLEWPIATGNALLYWVRGVLRQVVLQVREAFPSIVNFNEGSTVQPHLKLYGLGKPFVRSTRYSRHIVVNKDGAVTDVFAEPPSDDDPEVKDYLHVLVISVIRGKGAGRHPSIFNYSVRLFNIL